MTRQGGIRAAMAAFFLLTVAAGVGVDARQDPVAALRSQLGDRYDVLALQDGVGVIPRSRDAGVRIIEIRNGAVSVDGMTSTGDQLRMRLGADADLILRISYLDAAQQRQLAGGAEASASATPSIAPPPSAPPAPPPPPAAPRREREGRERGGDEIVRFGSNLTVNRGEIVDEVVVIGGNATIEGEVDGELTVIGGNATLGPEAVVRNDVTVVGGTLTRAPGSVIEGRVENVAMGDTPWGRGGGFGNMMRNTVFGRVGSFAGTVVRVGLLAVFALLVALFGRSWVERIAERASADPLRSGLTGFLGQVLFIPVLVVTVVILAVSIIGIPLLVLVPFGIIALVLVALVGFTGVAYYVGGLLGRRFGWPERSPHVTVLLGVLAIALITLLARAAAIVGGGLITFPFAFVGYIVEYIAWTLGFGAAILAMHRDWRTRRQPVTS